MNVLLFVFVVSFAILALPRGGEAKVHTFKITPEQAWNGMIESTIPPALFIDDGDTVIFNTVMLLEGKLAADMSITDLLALRKSVADRGNGTYAFTGPVYVNGAEAGDVLEIRIRRIVPGDFGVSYFYPGEMKLGGLPERFPDGAFRTLRYSEDKKTAEFQPGIVLPLRPFLGTMALAPRAGEKRPPAVPGYFAGNMDNKELVAGTKLFIPVSVKGALFMAADAHGCQGDGEVCITASETWFEEVELEFVVKKGMKLTNPRAETASHWIVMGFHEDLNEAVKIALGEAVDFLTLSFGLSEADAYTLCSLAVDFRVTQVVDGKKGIHGMIPKSIFDTSLLSIECQ
jgi:acetamidase/formamidase